MEFSRKANKYFVLIEHTHQSNMLDMLGDRVPSNVFFYKMVLLFAGYILIKILINIFI